MKLDLTLGTWGRGRMTEENKETLRQETRRL